MRVFLQIADDIAVGEVWHDQNRYEAKTVAQSKDATNIWMIEAQGDEGILVETLSGHFR